jgi:hypothetical protein
MANRFINFSVRISPEEVLAIYQGAIPKVIVISDTGLKIDMKASHFRQFTTSSGISGRFQMELDAQNKLVSLRKLA